MWDIKGHDPITVSLTSPTHLQQHLRLPRQIRSNPEHVVPMLLPRLLKPPIAVAITAPKQRVQLRQFDFKQVSCLIGCRGGVRRGLRDAACAAGRFGRRTPGHNSLSHLVCFLSKVTHVMWSDGQGVCAPWPSPFVPHVRTDAPREHRQPAVRWAVHQFT